MAKIVVFISHISEEKALAIELKVLLEKSFLGMIDVFVSSDENSISLGKRWLDNITDALNACVVELILCSPASVTRPWINFEAGAGWIRGIEVVPLCHSGMQPSTLPLPLNLLQAARIGDRSTITLISSTISRHLSSAVPTVDAEPFLDFVRAFEQEHTFMANARKCVEAINKVDAQILKMLPHAPGIKGQYTETQIGKIEDATHFLQHNGILTMRRTGNTTITGDGTFYSIEITQGPRFDEIRSLL